MAEESLNPNNLKNSEGINWEAISTQVRRTEYHKLEEELIIEFKSGAKYKYFKFKPEAYIKLAATQSIGKFINSDIKGKYEYVKL